jgi:hypothetical protein
MRIVMSFIVVAAIAYAALCAWVYVTQRSQIYFPTPEVLRPGAQALWVASQGERIKVWTVRGTGPGALIYFGGNAEDVAGNVDMFSALFPEHTLYLVNYRGYGGSSGHPSEAALLSDALAVYDQVRTRHPDVAVMGRSLGSGVGVYLASQRPVQKLVLVTAFDSFVSVARAHFPWLPVRFLLRERYDSAGRAGAVTAPVLVVTAADDEIIPRACSDALIRAFAADQVRLVVIPGAMHNTLDFSPAYLESVRAFLQERRMRPER